MYGKDYTIIEIAKKILKVVDIKAQIEFDKTKPDGSSKIIRYKQAKNYGWKSKIKLEEGLLKAYRFFIKLSEIFYNNCCKK